jgi:hypothetical protein
MQSKKEEHKTCFRRLHTALHAGKDNLLKIS